MDGKERDRVAVEAEKGNRRPIHHSPVFWIGILLCLAAIIIYVWSDDLSWRPHSVIQSGFEKIR